MTLSPERARVIAIHEAGHAVVANALRIGINSMTFAADDQGNSLAHVDTAETSWSQPGAPLTRRVRDRWERYVMIFWAGGLAQERVSYDRNQIIADSIYDSEEAHRLMAVLINDPSEKSSYYAKLRECTNAILMDPSWWRAVEMLADRFITSHKLSGRQVRRIIATARAKGDEAGPK